MFLWLILLTLFGNWNLVGDFIASWLVNKKAMKLVLVVEAEQWWDANTDGAHPNETL